MRTANNIRCDGCHRIYPADSWHNCSHPRAAISFTYPFDVNGTRAIGVTTTVVEGRKSHSSGGFAMTEAELRRDFEHFILDLKLLKVLK